MTMNAAVAAQLVALNRLFYADFGPSFSATRGRIQPGVRRILSQLQGDERILDLGCGNGELARTLAERGHQGTYTGLDFSLPLLKDAEHSPFDRTLRASPEGFTVNFQLADLTAPSWDSDPSARLRQSHRPDVPSGGQALSPSSFNLVFAFAALHHIPGWDMRLGILQKARSLLAPGGRFIHSEWQFLNSEKLRGRIQPWERANLSAADVDPGDALLDWRSDGNGLRYAHHFSEQELLDLAAASGFRVAESFLSDGTGGQLSLYQFWDLAASIA
jgi:tRNA (uracil-5-)-methyltransferase TRM9